MVKQIFISLASYLLLFLLAGSGAVLVLPLIVSLLCFLVYVESGAKDTIEVGQNVPETKSNAGLPFMASAPLAVFLGSVIASVLLSPRAMASYLSRGERWPAGLLLTPLGENQMTTWSTFLFVSVSTLVAAAFALCLFYYGRKLTRVAPGALLILIIVVFITASLSATPDFRANIATEPKYNDYSYDGIIYLKTFYLMAEKDFYQAYVEAASGDSRLIPVRAIRKGKFYGYVSNPFYFRQPILFYLWRLVAGNNGIGIFYLALAFSSGVIALGFSATRKLFGNQGVLAAIAIAPYLFVGQNWSNMLLPDWWAANALLAGVFFWLKKQFWPSALSFLAAVLFREVLLIFLLLFLVFALVWERRSAYKYIATAVVFIPFYAWHYILAGPFIGLKESTGIVILDRLSIDKFFSTAGYQFFVYGFNLIPVYVIVVLAATGWSLAKRWDMLILSLLAFPYFATASSYYWGQHLMLFLAFGAATVCLPRPDRDSTPKTKDRLPEAVAALQYP